jgi:hypothetical protein
MRKSTLNILFAALALMLLVSAASAALPATVKAKIYFPSPSGNSYFDVVITQGGGDIKTQTYYGWCADSKSSIGAFGVERTFSVYSSLEPTTIEPTIDSADWKKINYILNQQAVTDKYLIQAAIWYYDGGAHAWDGYPDATALANFISDIEANGADYVPDEPGEIYAVVLHIDGVQDVLIPVPIPDIPVPEFPTLALPVAMVLGVVFTLHVAKGRKD